MKIFWFGFSPHPAAYQLLHIGQNKRGSESLMGGQNGDLLGS